MAVVNVRVFLFGVVVVALTHVVEIIGLPTRTATKSIGNPSPFQTGSPFRAENNPSHYSPGDGVVARFGERTSRTLPTLEDTELMTGDDVAEDETDDPRTESQHLFPSFSSLFSGSHLSNSRPFYPEFTTPPRAFNTEPSFHHRALYTSAEDTDRVLGSGNFGVIRGGTYYSGSADEQYTRGVNSHGRPYRRPNPPPQYKLGGDFFSGFRDFADITTPTKSAYSNIFVVYANKNSTSSDRHDRPKNIRELIESETNYEYDDNEDEEEDDQQEEIPLKSKTKKKLNSFKQKQEVKERSKKFKSKSVDPLLALS